MIAGSRRWKACLLANLPLKAILTDYNDKQASIAQIKENVKLAYKIIAEVFFTPYF